MKKILFVSLLAVIGFTSKAQTVGGGDYEQTGDHGFNDSPVVWYDATDGKVHFSITYYFPTANFTYEEADAGIWYAGSDLPQTGVSEYFDQYTNPVPSGSKTYYGTIDISSLSSTTRLELQYGMNLAADNNISAGYNAHGIYAFYFTP